MKKYTQAEIKKFLEPETRFHMSAHVIQSEAVEMCRQLMAERGVLVDALKKYADKDKWDWSNDCYGDPYEECSSFGENGFEIAEQALKEVGEE